MKLICDKYKSLTVFTSKGKVAFVDGELVTNDKAVIRDCMALGYVSQAIDQIEPEPKPEQNNETDAK